RQGVAPRAGVRNRQFARSGGGMGVVYKARQTGLNRSVALKMIRHAREAGREELARFRSEAKALAGLHEKDFPFCAKTTFRIRLLAKGKKKRVRPVRTPRLWQTFQETRGPNCRVGGGRCPRPLPPRSNSVHRCQTANDLCKQ